MTATGSGGRVVGQEGTFWWGAGVLGAPEKVTG